MNLTNLDLEIIRKAHEEDNVRYRRIKLSPPPQHQHRHWLLKYIDQLEEQKNDETKADAVSC